MKRIILAIFLVMACFNDVDATRIYVSMAGSNATGDGSELKPYRGIKYVLQYNAHISAGDTCVVLNDPVFGYYRQETPGENIFKCRGSDNSYVYIMGDPEAGEPTIIDGWGTLNTSGVILKFTNHYDIPCAVDCEQDAEWLWFENLTFQNCNEPTTNSGLSIDDGGNGPCNTYPVWSKTHTPANNIVIRNCSFINIGAWTCSSCKSGSGIKFAGVDTFLVENCIFDECWRNGIDAVGCHEGIVRNNIFREFYSHNEDRTPTHPTWTCDDWGRGIVFKGASSNILIERNTFRNLSGQSIMIGAQTWDSPTSFLFRPFYGHYCKKVDKIWTADCDGSPDEGYILVDYENRATTVYRNVFINTGIPIELSHARDARIFNNTFYCPRQSPQSQGSLDNLCDNGATYSIMRSIWSNHNSDELRCGEAYSDPVPCTEAVVPLISTNNVLFQNNISVFGDTENDADTPSPLYHQYTTTNYACVASQAVDDTIKTNLWYCMYDTTKSIPVWGSNWNKFTPSNNEAGDPLFAVTMDSTNTFLDSLQAISLRLQSTSPAISMGTDISGEYFIYKDMVNFDLDTLYFTNDFFDRPYGTGAGWEVGAMAYDVTCDDSMYISKPDNDTLLIYSEMTATAPHDTIRLINHCPDDTLTGTALVVPISTAGYSSFAINNTIPVYSYTIPPNDVEELYVSYHAKTAGTSSAWIQYSSAFQSTYVEGTGSDSLYIVNPDTLDWGAFEMGSALVSKTVRLINHTPDTLTGFAFVDKNYYYIDYTVETGLNRYVAYTIAPDSVFEFLVYFIPLTRSSEAVTAYIRCVSTSASAVSFPDIFLTGTAVDAVEPDDSTIKHGKQDLRPIAP